MGGMVAQSYALAYPNPTSTSATEPGSGPNPTMLSLTLACTYAHPGPFCARLFAHWRAVALTVGVAEVMREVLLWAFTVPFFASAELHAIERAVTELDMGVPEYLAQLSVIEDFDSVAASSELWGRGEVLGGVRPGRVCVLVGEEDILIPVKLSRELWEGLVGAEWRTTRGGHGCVWEFAEEFNRSYIGFIKGVEAGE